MTGRRCMTTCLVMMMAFAVSSASAAVDRTVAGVYEDDERDASLAICGSGFAELRTNHYPEFASWSTRVIGGTSYLILDLFKRKRTAALALTDGVLRIVAYSEDLEEVKDDILNDGGVDPELSRYRFQKTEKHPDPDLASKAKKSRDRFQAELKARVEERTVAEIERKLEQQYRERRHQYEDLVEKFKTSPEAILDVKLKFPTRAEVDRMRRADYFYTVEMQGVGYAFVEGKQIAFKEETLLKFIDKCGWDWYRGFPLSAAAMKRNEIGAESRRRFAPNFLKLYGTINDMWVRPFLDHDNTPSDVIREALATKKLGKELTEKLDARLAAREKEGK